MSWTSVEIVDDCADRDGWLEFYAELGYWVEANAKQDVEWDRRFEGKKRILTFKFHEDDHDTALLFKLTWGGNV